MMPFLLAFPLAIMAQQLIFEEEVEKNPGYSISGPNQTHFLEARIFYGLIFGIQEQDYPLKTLGSGEFEMMMRYKLKLNSLLSCGAGAGYINQHYRVDTKAVKDFPDNKEYDREVFKMQSLKSTLFVRLNIDPRRGNYLGKYIESGVYGSWSFTLKRIMVDKFAESSDKAYRRSKEIQSGLDYLNRIQYGAYISLGISNFELSYRYRLSGIMNSEDYEFDFPGNSIGISYKLN